MAYKYYFREARKEVDYGISKRLSAYDELNQYKNDPNIYISFRSIDKIGINPESGEYSTPIGIYAYPLKEIWKGFDHRNKQIEVDSYGHHPYIYIVKSKGRGIDNLSKYSNLKNDIKILESKYSNVDFMQDYDWKEFIKDMFEYADFKSQGGKLWQIVKYLSNDSYIKWNKIFSDDLKYNYIVDRGKGIIHPGEPAQAIFFSVKGFDIVDKVIQDEYRKDIYNY